MTQVVVVGSANTDFVVQVPELPGRGETVVGGEFMTAHGGKGANQAVAAARLGAQVSLVAKLGADSLGQETIEAYQHEGMDTRCVFRDAQSPSGVALILVDRQGENIIAVAPGANHHLLPVDVAAAELAFQDADCLLLQLEIPLETVSAAIQQATIHSIPVILNPAPARTIPMDLLEKVTVLTPNEHELRTLCQDDGSTELVQLAVRLHQLSGVRDVVVTLGAKGALVVSPGGVQRVPAFNVKPVDTTACGDAFNAALAVRLGMGSSLSDAVRFANAAGALTATRPGAQPSLPRLEEVEKFLQRANV